MVSDFLGRQFMLNNYNFRLMGSKRGINVLFKLQNYYLCSAYTCSS